MIGTKGKEKGQDQDLNRVAPIILVMILRVHHHLQRASMKLIYYN